MAASFIQEGDVFDYVNTTAVAIPNGSVVRMGNMLGVAVVTIVPGATGSVVVEGVHLLDKVPATAIAQGEKLLWDSSLSKFDGGAASPATGDVSGTAVAFEAAIAGATKVKVLFTGAPGVVA